MLRWWVFSCSLLLSAAVAAQDRPPEEALVVPSLTLTDSEFLQGDVEGKPPVSLAGRLQLPGDGDRYPAAIILHGSGGDGFSFGQWSELLLGIGVATLRLDSYTARGKEEIFSDQGSLGEFYAVLDTYRAADVLAAHPKIDPSRIVVVGFSRGGIGALYSAMTRFNEMYRPGSAPIAAHLPFYPPCNFVLERELETTGAPIRAFHGEADAWNPLPRCAEYVARLKDVGADVEIATYPDALHAFDNAAAPAYQANPKAQTSRACFRVERDGVLINADTDKPFSWQDACVENGPSQQYQDAAATAARKAVVSFLTELFRS